VKWRRRCCRCRERRDGVFDQALPRQHWRESRPEASDHQVLQKPRKRLPKRCSRPVRGLVYVVLVAAYVSEPATTTVYGLPPGDSGPPRPLGWRWLASGLPNRERQHRGGTALGSHQPCSRIFLRCSIRRRRDRRADCAGSNETRTRFLTLPATESRQKRHRRARNQLFLDLLEWSARLVRLTEGVFPRL